MTNVNKQCVIIMKLVQLTNLMIVVGRNILKQNKFDIFSTYLTIGNINDVTR